MFPALQSDSDGSEAKSTTFGLTVLWWMLHPVLANCPAPVTQTLPFPVRSLGVFYRHSWTLAIRLRSCVSTLDSPLVSCTDFFSEEIGWLVTWETRIAKGQPSLLRILRLHKPLTTSVFRWNPKPTPVGACRSCKYSAQRLFQLRSSSQKHGNAYGSWSLYFPDSMLGDCKLIARSGNPLRSPVSANTVRHRSF